MKEGTFEQVKQDLIKEDHYLRHHELRFRLSAKEVQKVSEKTNHTPRILDIGCWPGYLSLYYQREGWEVDAIDLNPERIPTVSEAGVKIIKHNLNTFPQLPYPENHFDSILFTEVFEHLNPASFEELFAGIESCLKPGGRLILTTPNRWALNKNMLQLKTWDEPEVDEEGHGHWKEYRLHEVLECFGSNNLKILKQETISFYSHLGRSNQTGYFPLKEWYKHPNKAVNFAKVLVYPIRNLPPFRDSLLIVAEKPQQTL